MIKKALLQIKQNLFYKKIRIKINKNKSYPRKAIRRGIGGNIKVQFLLLKNGDIKIFKW